MQSGSDRCSTTETRPELQYIRTFSGRKVWPTDPRTYDFTIEDIAHALSLLCRFTGHVRRFYSVGEHSIRVSDLCSSENKLWGLLHDASEAYLVDLARPIKHTPGFGEIYREVEAKIMACICEKFGLNPKQPEEVTYYDNVLLRTEQRDLMPVSRDGKLGGEELELKETLIPMPSEIVEDLFLKKFYQLSQKQ